MSTTENIFAAPQVEVADVAGSDLLTETIVVALRQTRPWVLLLAGLGFASAVLLGLIAIPMLLGLSFMGDNLGSSGMLMGIGVFYLILAGVTLLASLHLLKFAGAIKRVLESFSMVDFEQVMVNQARFWRLVGILSLLSVVMMIVFILGAIGVVIVGANF